jgi:hypothetical protein
MAKVEERYINFPLRQEPIEVSHCDVRRLPAEPEHLGCLQPQHNELGSTEKIEISTRRT